MVATTVWSPSQIRDLWVRSGGSAMYADIATAIAQATSGGRPDYVAQQEDGSVNRGLWGINSKYGQLSTQDPTGNARGAVELSRNGTDWREWPSAYDSNGYLGATSVARNLTPQGSPLGQYPTAGNRPTTQVQGLDPNDFLSPFGGILGQVLDWLGLPTPVEMVMRYGKIILYFAIGVSMILVGFVLMFLSLRQVRNVAVFAGETAASGLGFGAGAAVVSGRGSARKDLIRSVAPRTKPMPSAPATVPTPKPPPPASRPMQLPEGRHTKGTSVQETLLRAKQRQPVSGGYTQVMTSTGSPMEIFERKRPMQSPLWPERTLKPRGKRARPLFGPEDDR